MKEYLYWNRKKDEFVMQKTKSISDNKYLITEEILFLSLIGTYDIKNVPLEISYAMGKYVSTIKGQNFLWDYIPFISSYRENKIIRVYSPANYRKNIYIRCNKEDLLLNMIHKKSGYEFETLRWGLLHYQSSHKQN